VRTGDGVGAPPRREETWGLGLGLGLGLGFGVREEPLLEREKAGFGLDGGMEYSTTSTEAYRF